MNFSNHRIQLNDEYRRLIAIAQADLIIFCYFQAGKATTAELNDVGNMLLMGGEISR